MKYPTRLSDAVHILAFIALYPNCDLTSTSWQRAFRRILPMYASSCPPCGREGCWSA